MVTEILIFAFGISVNNLHYDCMLCSYYPKEV